MSVNKIDQLIQEWYIITAPRRFPGTLAQHKQENYNEFDRNRLESVF